MFTFHVCLYITHLHYKFLQFDLLHIANQKNAMKIILCRIFLEMLKNIRSFGLTAHLLTIAAFQSENHRNNVY